MKWYLTPANREFDGWNKAAMQKLIGLNISLPSAEPNAAILYDDFSILPLSDERPSLGEFQIITGRSVSVGEGSAEAVYTVGDMSVEAAQTKRMKVINETCDTLMKSIGASYPDSEIATWDQQKIEAERYTADNNASTPLIDALASARGIAKPELVTRILAKAEAYAVATGTLIGTRQAIEDVVMADNATLEDIEGAVWPT